MLYANFPLALVFSYIILRKKSIQVSELIGSVVFFMPKSTFNETSKYLYCFFLLYVYA